MADEAIREESADSTVTGALPEAKKSAAKISFSIWPPSQRTRGAIVQRLITTLSSPSIISKRYGVIPLEEASDLAARIEEESFAAVNPVTPSPDDDGIDILQIYSQEISRRMLDTVKARSGSTQPPAAPAPAVKEDAGAEEALAGVKEDAGAEEALAGVKEDAGAEEAPAEEETADKD